eukprot:1932873-Pleurochrysis_carterae.AAC.1
MIMNEHQHQHQYQHSIGIGMSSSTRYARRNNGRSIGGVADGINRVAAASWGNGDATGAST